MSWGSASIHQTFTGPLHPIPDWSRQESEHRRAGSGFFRDVDSPESSWLARPESAKGVSSSPPTPFADSGRATQRSSLLDSYPLSISIVASGPRVEYVILHKRTSPRPLPTWIEARHASRLPRLPRVPLQSPP